MDYLKSDDDYIQLIANEQESISRCEENAFNVIAVCECFIQNRIECRDLIFDLCCKYLESIAYARVVMEYVTTFYNNYDSTYIATRIANIWKSYFNDGRYGRASGMYGQLNLCERFDINVRVSLEIVKVFERSNVTAKEKYIDELKKCGQKRFDTVMKKLPEKKKYVDYDDESAVDCIVERISLPE